MAATASLVANPRKRPHAPHAPSADCACLENGFHVSSNKRRSSFGSYEACACVSSANGPCTIEKERNLDLDHDSCTRILASSPARCITDYTDTADSSTGSSCCSSLPGYESSLTGQQTLYCTSADNEAESCCGGDGASEMDITCFLHDGVWDDANNESFSFNPETIFLNEAGFVDCSSEAAPLVGYSAENGSWFLNDLDGHGQAFLNEVLDQEWMAAAVANLEKLNDTLTADSCVMHLLEADQIGKDY